MLCVVNIIAIIWRMRKPKHKLDARGIELDKELAQGKIGVGEGQD